MTEWNNDNNTIMKSTMKKLLIAIVAMIAAALSFAIRCANAILKKNVSLLQTCDISRKTGIVGTA